MASQFPIVKGATAKVTFPIYDDNGDLLSSAAGLDSEYSQDGGVFSDCSNEATEMTSGGAGTGIYYLNLTTTETNCDVLTILVKTSSATGKPTPLTYFPSAQNLDTIDTNIDSILAKMPTNYVMGSSDQNDNDLIIDAIKERTDNLPNEPADDSKVDIIDTNVDTIVAKLPTDYIMGSSNQSDYNDEIIAIKAKTDNLPASPAPANEYDAGVNVLSISGDSTAADNLEATYDGTGYVDDAAPATQEQIGRLVVGSAAISTTSESFTLTTGNVTSGDYTDTVAEDGTYHIVEPDTGTTDAYYVFDVGGNGVPVTVTWVGYAQSRNDTYQIYAYNYGSSAWEQIGKIKGKNVTTQKEYTFDLTNAHVGTGANLGEVKFRLESSDGTKMATDRLLCSYSVVTKSVGYSMGAIWVDTNGSNTNTEAYVDGTADNPVSTWAAALTLSSTLSIKKFAMINGSSIALSGNSDNYTMIGEEWSLDLNGQNIDNLFVEHSNVHGTATGTAYRFVRCKIALSSAISLEAGGLKECALGDAGISLSAAGTYLWDDCFSGVAGTGTPSVDFGAAVGNQNLNMRHYSGGMEVKNIGANGTDNMSLEGDGQLVLNANCAGGIIAIRGNFTVTDNASGAVTLSDDARVDAGQILDAVTDDAIKIDGSSVNAVEALATAIKTKTDNLPASPAPASEYDTEMAHITADVATEAKQDDLEAIISEMVDIVVADDGAVVGDGSNDAITFKTDLPGSDELVYKDSLLVFTYGNLRGQSRRISAFNPSTGFITVDSVFSEAPADGDTIYTSPQYTPGTKEVVDNIKKYIINKLTVDTTTSQMKLYDDDGTTVLLTWDITDKDGGTITIESSVPTNRGVPS